MTEELSEELRRLELALCVVRAAIAVQYPKSPSGSLAQRALAHQRLALWLTAEAEEQVRAMLAAMKLPQRGLRHLRADD